ncbi:MAG: hypothetical protein LBT08_10645 [Synergistaceae bacterium]|jgi:hypothetical protein|nr:hypothetical protein [Synergistaceae bacterium]
MGESENKKSLEKRLKRIERWLKRCMAACGCGSWSSALMEIECMEAEARGLKDDLWRTVENETLGSRQQAPSFILGVFRVSAVAAAMVMAAVLPLSVDQDRPLQSFEMESIEILTSTESEILSALRQTLSSRNRGAVTFSVEIPADLPVEKKSVSVASAAEPHRIAGRKSDAADKAEPRMEPEEVSPREPTLEDVISLIQVGQRALRASEPAVSIHP